MIVHAILLELIIARIIMFITLEPAMIKGVQMLIVLILQEQMSNL
jgi:hypothetical protein